MQVILTPDAMLTFIKPLFIDLCSIVHEDLNAPYQFF